MPFSPHLEMHTAEVRLGILTSPVSVRAVTREGLVFSGFPMARVGDALSVHFANHRRLRAHVVDIAADDTALRFDEPLAHDDGLLGIA